MGGKGVYAIGLDEAGPTIGGPHKKSPKLPPTFETRNKVSIYLKFFDFCKNYILTLENLWNFELSILNSNNEKFEKCKIRAIYFPKLFWILCFLNCFYISCIIRKIFKCFWWENFFTFFLGVSFWRRWDCAELDFESVGSKVEVRSDWARSLKTKRCSDGDWARKSALHRSLVKRVHGKRSERLGNRTNPISSN